MRRIWEISSIGVSFLIIISTLIGFVGVGVVTSNERPPIGQAPPVNTTTTTDVISQSQGEDMQAYTVTASNMDAIDAAQLTEYGEIGTRADRRIELTMSPSDLAAVRNISWVIDVRPVMHPEPAQADIPGSAQAAGENNSLGVQQAHQNGVTGENIEIGIIDKGFDADNPTIESNVVDTQSFRRSPGNPAHGTSVAEIVTQTAPDSQLYLVSTSTGTDIEAAISYLLSEDVDIIVHSQGIPALNDDGDHFLTDDINAATEDGSLFINAAGNEAQTHWEGEFRDTDTDGIHEWTKSGDELNCLRNCEVEYSGSITVYIRWEDQGKESHYRPLLFNPRIDQYIAIDDNRVFATSTGERYALLRVKNIQSQPVDLVVDHVSGPADDRIEVIIPSGPRQIQRNIPASSIIAPGDVSDSLTTAAYEVGPRQLAPYSSRGPTDDGRTGIDVTGYTNIGVTNGLYASEEFRFTGTSAAAPYAGGIAALVEDNQPGDQSPAEITDTLKSSSDDILNVGTDAASGSGVINAADAVDALETEAPTATPESTMNPFSNSILGADAEGPPTDIDDDGKFEDVNGDNRYTFDDVIALAFVDTEKLTNQQRDALDFDHDGNIDFDDVVELAFER